MIIYDLVCTDGHRFEGWFTQPGDFRTQQDQGLLNCPQCGSHEISKLPTASRIRTDRQKKAREDQAERATALEKLQRAIDEHFEDVGDQFPEEARRIHYGESEPRDIRGTATADEARELLEEGVDVVAVPGVSAKKKLN